MFALFEWQSYYPEGGWNDCSGVFDSMGEAVAHRDRDCTTESCLMVAEHAQIIDLGAGAVLGTWEREVRAVARQIEKGSPGVWEYPGGVQTPGNVAPPAGTIRCRYDEWEPA